MTQDEIIEMAIQAGMAEEIAAFNISIIEAFAKLVAAKAIAELESQEPVAWVAEDVCEGQYIDGRPRKIWWECKEGIGTAFYTHSLQRTWVGLSDEDISKISQRFGIDHDDSWTDLKQAIEAKLKERNDHSI